MKIFKHTLRYLLSIAAFIYWSAMLGNDLTIEWSIILSLWFVGLYVSTLIKD